MGLRLLVPPAIEPVTLDEAKLHLRVDNDDENTLIEALIKAAREYAEVFQNRAYITQTWELWLDNWPKWAEYPYFRLPRSPLQTVESIKYYDSDGGEHVVTDYIVDDISEPARVIPAGDSWPNVSLRKANGIAITFKAGYGDDAASVPASIKQALLLLVGHWYENRENVVLGAAVQEMPFAAKTLLWQERIVVP